MKAAYKWRIENGLYAYITDEVDNGFFVYDLSVHEREYGDGTIISGSPVNDNLISSVVSRFTKKQYIQHFDVFKQFMGEEYPDASLLDVSYYYNMENDECTTSASALKCYATDLIFDATAVIGDNLSVTVVNEQTSPNIGEELRYRLDFVFPIEGANHRPIKVNNEDFLGNNTTPLNLSGGTNINLTKRTGGTVIIEADGYVFDQTKGTFAEKYKQDSHDGGQIATNTASGNYSAHAEGYGTTASGEYGSHAEGFLTVATGSCAHSEGISTNAYGEGSHAEGGKTTASGKYAHSEGQTTHAIGLASHVEGWGDYAHNAYNTAEGEASHVEGIVTTALNKAEHAEGTCNLSHKATDEFGSSGNTLSSIGFKDDNFWTSVRKNAREIMQNGDCYLYGVGNYDGVHIKGEDPSIEVKTLQEVLNSSGSDEKVKQSTSDTNDVYPLLASDQTTTEISSGDNHGSIYDTSININPGKHSVSEGINTKAIGNYSHAEGVGSFAGAQGAHAEGGIRYSWNGGYALGGSTHAEGASGIIPIVLNYISGHSFSFSFSTSGIREIYDAYDGVTKPGHTIINAEDFDEESLDFVNVEQYLIEYVINKSSIGNTWTFIISLDDYNGNAVPQSNFNGLLYGGMAIGSYSHIEGGGNIAIGKGAHAEGTCGLSNHDCTHAEGWASIATGLHAHSEGQETKAIGENSHAEGISTIANGSNSHAEGHGFYYDTNITITSLVDRTDAQLEQGGASHFRVGDVILYNKVMTVIDEIDELNDAIIVRHNLTLSPDKTIKKIKGIAYAANTHVEGHNSVALEYCCHAEGYNTLAYGGDEGCSHAEGCETMAVGEYSHTEGYETMALGICSHAGGRNTIADKNSMTAIGKYNKTGITDCLLAVGNGTSSSRGNAFTVKSSGTDTTIARVNGVDDVQLGLPIGSITMWAGTTAPSGWFLCDGKYIPTTNNSYSTASAGYEDCQNLLNLITTTYGVKDSGAGTVITVKGQSVTGYGVKIPDLRQRFPLGSLENGTIGKNGHASDSPGWSTNIGTGGGESENTLSSSEMPTHRHNLLPKPNYSSQEWVGHEASATNKGSYLPLSTTLSGNLWVQTDDVGDSNSHNNIPPYLAINFIIKYL